MLLKKWKIVLKWKMLLKKWKIVILIIVENVIEKVENCNLDKSGKCYYKGFFFTFMFNTDSKSSGVNNGSNC